MNRNKRSATLNVGTPKGLALTKRLIGTADVVLENFAPGTMDKLGLGYIALRAVKPDIIMLSSSGFGATGPWRSYTALHSGIILLSGLGAVTGYRDGQQRLLGSALPDSLTALYGALAITQAMYHHRRTGQGQHVETAMTELVLSLLPEAVAEFTMLNRETPRLGNRHLEKAPHGIFPARGDDRWLALAIETDGEWRSLCRVMSRPQLSDDERFRTSHRRLKNIDLLEQVISSWTKRHDPFELAEKLQAVGICAGPVCTEDDLLNNQVLQRKGFGVETLHPRAGVQRMVGAPWSFTPTQTSINLSAPLLGADNEYVFGELIGLRPDEMTSLMHERVIY